MLKIDIKLHPSYQYLIFNFLLLIFTILILLFLPINIFTKLLVSIFVCIYSGSIVYHYGLLLSPHAIKRISLTEDGWNVWNDHRVLAVKLCGSSTLTTNICILKFKLETDNFKKSCIILRDSLPDLMYKKLLHYTRGL